MNKAQKHYYDLCVKFEGLCEELAEVQSKLTMGEHGELLDGDDPVLKIATVTGVIRSRDPEDE